MILLSPDILLFRAFSENTS